VGAAARVLARRGTFNLVGRRPLDGPVQVDLGRLHYDYVAFLGSQGPDLAVAYGTARNRCELRAGGTAVFVGAGGPMGQMHVQRALELPDGPRRLIATEVSDERLETLRGMFAPLAAKLGREIIFFNPVSAKRSLADLVQELTGGEGVDDVVVCVPVAKLMEEAGTIMKADAMLVAFAGIPNGTYGALDLGRVYLGNAQYTGTSGLTLNDQALVMERRVAGTLSPGRSVAAIGGLDMAAEAIQSVMDGKFPGKVVVFPQIPDLPLMGLKELAEKLPDVAAKLGEDLMWTNEAEAALIDHCWKQA
jgi:NADPH:quinone reductase-like Zn-dependent oxidoreductase